MGIYIADSFVLLWEGYRNVNDASTVTIIVLPGKYLFTSVTEYKYYAVTTNINGSKWGNWNTQEL